MTKINYPMTETPWRDGLDRMRPRTTYSFLTVVSVTAALWSIPILWCYGVYYYCG